MAQLIKDQVKAEAAERLMDAQEKGRRSRHGKLDSVSQYGVQNEAAGALQDETEKAPSRSRHETRNKIAKAVGMGHVGLDQATRVVENGIPELVDAKARWRLKPTKTYNPLFLLECPF